MVNCEKEPAPGADDRQLLEQAAAGDPASFDSLMDRYCRPFVRLAYSLVGDAAAAEDVVQETFLAAFSGMRSFRWAASVRTWLVSILVRQAARHRRREGLRKHALLEEAEAKPAGDAVRQADMKMDLAWALEGLDERYRQAIVLREIEGLSYDEIARVLSVPRGTVESRLHRARAALREKLSGRGR